MNEDSQSFIDVYVDIDRIRLSKGRFSYVGPWSFCMVIPLVVCLAPPCFVHFIIQVLAASMRIVPAGYSFQLSRLISQWPNTLTFIANIFSSAKRKIANYCMIDYNELFLYSWHAYAILTYVTLEQFAFHSIVCKIDLILYLIRHYRVNVLQCYIEVTIKFNYIAKFVSAPMDIHNCRIREKNLANPSKL